MSSFRTFKTVHVDREPDWRPLAAVSRVVRATPDLPSFHPGEFMCMATLENRRKGVVLRLYKHYDTRRYINLDQAGHAYEYWPGSDEQWERDREVTPRFGGRYRLHRSLEHAVHRLGLWELECGRLGRSFPPEKWPADPDDMAIGAYMDGERFAWIMACSTRPLDPPSGDEP